MNPNANLTNEYSLVSHTPPQYRTSLLLLPTCFCLMQRQTLFLFFHFGYLSLLELYVNGSSMYVFWVCRFKMQWEVSIVCTSSRIAEIQKIKLRFVRMWSNINYGVIMYNVDGKCWIVNSLTTLGEWLDSILVTLCHCDKNPWQGILNKGKTYLVYSFTEFGSSWQGRHGRTELRTAWWSVWSRMWCPADFLPTPLHSIQASRRWDGTRHLQSVSSSIS